MDVVLRTICQPLMENFEGRPSFWRIAIRTPVHLVAGETDELAVDLSLVLMSRLPWNFAAVRCRAIAELPKFFFVFFVFKKRKLQPLQCEHKKTLFAQTENEEQTDGRQKYQERLW